MIDQQAPVVQKVFPPFQGIPAKEKSGFRMILRISNAAELKDAGIVPKQAVFLRSDNTEFETGCSWNGNDFTIDAPLAAMTFTDNLKLVRIIGDTAQGRRVIWP